MMNARERVLTAMRRTGKPDRSPFEISWGAFTPSLMETYRTETGASLPPEEYFDFDTRSVELNPTRRRTDFRPWYDELPNGAMIDEWGCGSVPGALEHFARYSLHPLARCRSAEEVAAFAWPDVTAGYRYEGMVERIGAFHKRGYAVTAELYQTIYERAWLLRGMESFMTDLLAAPGIAHAICQELAELRVEQARQYAACGADILRLGDDMCSQQGLLMDLGVYREFFKGRMRSIVAAAKSVNPDILVFMHCDGCVRDIIPEYVDMGVDILNPVQPECNDLCEIKRLYGDRLSFWGGIGTQTTMPFASPEEVRESVRKLKATLGPSLLLAPSHILEPEVPWPNVLAFIEAAREANVGAH